MNIPEVLAVADEIHASANVTRADVSEHLNTWAARLRAAVPPMDKAPEGVFIPKAEMDAAESGEIPDWASPLMTVHQHGAEYAVEQLAKILNVTDWDADGGSESYEGDLQHSISSLLQHAAGCPGEDIKVVPKDAPEPPAPEAVRFAGNLAPMMNRAMRAYEKVGNTPAPTGQGEPDYIGIVLANSPELPAARDDGEPLGLYYPDDTDARKHWLGLRVREVPLYLHPSPVVAEVAAELEALTWPGPNDRECIIKSSKLRALASRLRGEM